MLSNVKSLRGYWKELFSIAFYSNADSSRNDDLNKMGYKIYGKNKDSIIETNECTKLIICCRLLNEA